MLCFGDMTFCAADCLNVRCVRNKAQEKQEREWAKDSKRAALPTSLADFSDGCRDYQPVKEEK